MLEGDGMSKGRLATLPKRIATIDTRVGSSPATERIRGYALTKIRERILLRDEYTCRACGRVSVHLEIHHDTPLHLGGMETDANRISLCKACHALRSAEEEKGRG